MCHNSSVINNLGLSTFMHPRGISKHSISFPWTRCFSRGNVLLVDILFLYNLLRKEGTIFVAPHWTPSYLKLGAYADAVRGLGAHLHDISPWACGGKEPITPGHRARVTTGLPQFTFCNSEVTTPCLTSCTYSLPGEQGHRGIGKTAQFFPLRPGIEPGTSQLWAEHATVAPQSPFSFSNVLIVMGRPKLYHTFQVGSD